MRERLIDMLNYIPCKQGCGCSALDGDRCGDLDKLDRCQIEAIADYLLADGWTRPPVKIGQTVYLVEDWGYKKEFKEIEVGTIVINGVNDSCKYIWEDVYGGSIGTFADIGKTIFLTREAAEEALKGGEE